MTFQSIPLKGTSSLPGYTLPPVPLTGVRVLLLRHGRSTLNDAGCYQGSSDQSELTPQGQLACQQMGRYLRFCHIDQVYTSPLGRALQSVQMLLPQLTGFTGTAITSSLLREIDLPAWQGLPYNEVKVRFPQDYHRWQTQPDQFAMDIGDGCHQPVSNSGLHSPKVDGPKFYPVRDVYERAREFWRKTLPHHHGQTLLIVSHGSTLQALINSALKLPVVRHHGLQQTHSGLTVIDFAIPTPETGHLHILNLTSPTGERLPKLKAGKQGLRLLLFPYSGSSLDTLLKIWLQGETLQAALLDNEDDDNHDAQSIKQWLQCYHSATPIISLRQWSQTFGGTLTQNRSSWLTAIAPTLGHCPISELTTVLLMAQPQLMASLLETLMGVPTISKVTLYPDTLTVLHYSSNHPYPILQGLNLVHSSRTLNRYNFAGAGRATSAIGGIHDGVFA